MRIFARAPDHLGDGVMALPGLAALAEQGELFVQGPRWAAELYRHLPIQLDPEGRADRLDLVVLFKPSFRAALAVRGQAPRRVGLASARRGWLLTTAVPVREVHRVEELNEIARAAGAEPAPLPCFPTTEADLPALDGLPEGLVLLVPGTASPRTVRWPGFAALAEALGERAVYAGGPADLPFIHSIAGPHRVLPPLSIPAFAALSCRARAIVGNDSGLPHLAAAARRAAGLPVQALHVIHGSTDPARTGPPGATSHAGTRPACWPCYKKQCGIGTPCLDLPASLVAAALA